MKCLNFIFLFASTIFLFACNSNSEMAVGDCLQKPDQVFQYKIEKINSEKFELLNQSTQETEFFDSLEGFMKVDC